MDRTEHDMKLVGFLGIFKHSFKTIFKSTKIFAQIALTLILPLAIIFLAHIEITNRYSIFSRIEDDEQSYSSYLNITITCWLYYILFKIVYLTLLAIFSVPSTAAIVFTMASVYTDRDVVFKKFMTLVIPNIWKKLFITFVTIYFTLFIYNTLHDIVLAITQSIFTYDSVLHIVVVVVTVLEKIHGFEALKKGKLLASGKKMVGMGIAFVLYGYVGMACNLFQRKIILFSLRTGFCSVFSFRLTEGGLFKLGFIASTNTNPYQVVSTASGSSGCPNRRDRRQEHRRFAARGNGLDQRDPRDTEIERLQQRIRDLEFNQHHGYDRYDPHDRNDPSITETVIKDDYDNDGRFENVFACRARHHEPTPPPPVDPIRALGIRTEIPEFEGRMQPDDFIDWLHTVERIFDLRQVPEHLKVKLVAIRLRKYTSLWWEHVQNKRYREGKHKVETWEKMKRLMRSKLVPVNHKQDSFLEYHNLKQAALPVEEFIVKFEQLRMRCGIEEDEEQTIARFLGPLRSDIATVVMLQQYWSFSDVCRLAQRVERQLAAKPKPTTRFSSYKPATSTSQSWGDNPKPDSTLDPQQPSGPGNIPNRCYKCNGISHVRRDCPNKQFVALIEDTVPTYDTEPEHDSDELSEVLYPDRGEALVIRRVLNTNLPDTSDDTAWLRNSIFRTKCTSKGKVCTVIIDGGSCENIVSQSMVDKLNLPTQDHPEPFQLTWLKKGNLIKVTHRCLVQFSIGNKYSDEIWCEVLPMDACHILLGRPWQYDRRAKHDGFRNTLGTVPTTQLIFGLLIAEENPDVPQVPSEVQTLLSEFSDVFLEEIPAGLPLTRDIQHCIDFLPGASVPNKQAYRMNPKEFTELQRQVTELLEKGLIRESMSPCAVPVLLVPKPNRTFLMCIDSRAVNKITIKYRFPIPRFDDLLDHLHGAQVFSKNDLRSGYHQIRMRPGDEWKTAFKTRDGLYEWMVMPFGLSNAPSTFMRLMNHIFKPFIGRCVVVYFDGILVYSSDVAHHLSHMRDIFTVLRDQKLYANGKKCHFLTSESSFDALKLAVTQAPVLALPNFLQVFQVECDASGLGIGGVLSQQHRPTAFFSEKLSDTRRRYNTYDKEFFAIVRSLEYWRHYLLPNEFILYSDHQALKFIQGQAKMNPRHAKWVETLQDFSFVILHKAGTANSVADALSRRPALTTAMSFDVVGFHSFSNLYQDDPDFGDNVWKKTKDGPYKCFFRKNGLLFLGDRLCVPLSSFREAIALECHQGALAGHFGRDKTIALIQDRFYWPKISKEVSKILSRCRICHIAKTRHTNQGPYTPLPTPVRP
ncbi:uncharacterized protein LOC143566842 [Bidens hawaiensis]|uniref:uncharacterized protein LOC143566842 n=1 Tax=Bidens hawaiensis TaxID=980011 RepID=UPI0040491154